MPRVLIDTDCGTDDACAILLAVRVAQKEPDFKIEAITTCGGNVELAKVRPNVLRVLHLCNATEIPVFEGASHPLVEPFQDACYQHGHDGFGDAADLYEAPDIPVPEEHAVCAMIRLARHFKDELIIVALGPLTNVALAQKLDPTFLTNIRQLIVLGGSCTGSGNHSAGAEFNFSCDPEAMAIVVNEAPNAEKLTIVTMDACKDYPIDWPWFDALDESNKYIQFLKRIMAKAANRWRAVGHPGIYVYDMTAVAVLLDGEVAAETITCPVYPELNGKWCRGAIVLDRRASDRWQHEANARVVSALSTDRLKRMYIRLM